jgi:hypothetical protein
MKGVGPPPGSMVLPLDALPSDAFKEVRLCACCRACVGLSHAAHLQTMRVLHIDNAIRLSFASNVVDSAMRALGYLFAHETSM